MDAVDMKNFYGRLAMYEFLKVLYDLDGYNDRLPKEINVQLQEDLRYVRDELLRQIESVAYGRK
jgi:hypothetical protein